MANWRCGLSNIENINNMENIKRWINIFYFLYIFDNMENIKRWISTMSNNEGASHLTTSINKYKS